jgi:DNA-binding response OmpR family regulator
MALRTFPTAAAFREHYRDGVFSLVSLDFDLPDGNGLGWLKHLPEQLQPNALVLFLSAHKHSADCVAALDAVAGDFIVKSADKTVLLARIRALLRRANNHSEVRQVGHYRIDRMRRQVMVDSLPGAPLSKELLLNTARGGEARTGTRTVETHANRV